jgi:hypothetical protein
MTHPTHPDTRTDRELLELAAKAAGIPDQEGGGGYMFAEVGELHAVHWGIVTFLGIGNIRFWNPLDRGDQAIDLLVKLGLTADTRYMTMVDGLATRIFRFEGIQHSPTIVEELHGTDAIAATRRAIVRAAADIGDQQ